MSSVSLRIAVSLLATALLLPTQAQGATAATENSILRVYSTSGGETRSGTGFVIHQQQAGTKRVVYVATSARLFDRDGPRRARILIGDNVVDVGVEDILMPYGNAQDVAIMRVATDAAVTVLPVSFDPVHAGTAFVVSGLGDANEPVAVSEHARFVTSRTVTGDRFANPLASCQGAPAIARGGAFGVVASCAPNEVPVISRLSPLRSFIERNVPGLVTYPSTARQPTVNEREVHGPTLNVPFGEFRAGEVDVPLPLASREALIGVAPRLISPTPLPSAEVTVLSFHHRTVRLRFTIGGPSLPEIPSSWPSAQALVVVRLTFVSIPGS